jgi:hypothetical protein
MKILLICAIFFSFLACNTNSSKPTKEGAEQNSEVGIIDSTFRYHFNVLDSVIKANPKDSIFACCSASIKFMEEKTGIEAQADGTLLGKLEFSKIDFQRWHEWYNKEYKKEN